MNIEKILQGLEHFKIGISAIQEGLNGAKYETGEAVVEVVTEGRPEIVENEPKKSRGRPKKVESKEVVNIKGYVVATIDENGKTEFVDEVVEESEYKPEPKPAPVVTPAAAEPATVIEITPLQLRAACIEHAAKNGKENTYKLLSRFGASKASEVKPEDAVKCYDLLKKEI